MPELLLHYIWMKGLFRTMPQVTTDGRLVEVISVGTHNTDQGPDFFGATIRIGGVTWSGNVEIHLKSSDWYQHGHQKDKAYDNIILHVVKQADREVFNSVGDSIVQCELQYPQNSEYLAEMLADKTSLCAQKLLGNPALLAEDWKTALLQDRMQKKSLAISQLLQLSHNDWEQAFYVTLAHNFGFHTNGVPFELLAKHTPLEYLRKHRDSLFQLEALLYGQSGLLTAETVRNEYERRLQKEYDFLRKKFNLQPIEGSLWKRLRMRPQNFPDVRIAQFASLLRSSETLLSKVLRENDPAALREMFSVITSENWNNQPIGRSAIDIILINSVVPYKFAWGREHSLLGMQEDAFRLLESLPAEKNHVTEQWKMLGIKAHTAADSQALIHLYQDYCIRHRCLHCDVGYQIFSIVPESEQKKRSFTQTELPF